MGGKEPRATWREEHSRPRDIGSKSQGQEQVRHARGGNKEASVTGGE